MAACVCAAGKFCGVEGRKLHLEKTNQPAPLANFGILCRFLAIVNSTELA